MLEVGSRDVNGSLRPYLESFQPASYMGVDIFPGPGVDEVCNATHLLDCFGRDAFDVVLSTEMLEHAREWSQVIDNLKLVLRPGGILLLTTRSRGFPFHEAPHDFWRYEIADMRAIFSDFDIETLEPDPQEPGVFLKARKPAEHSPKDLSGHCLFSMVTGTYVHAVDPPAESKYEGKLVRRQGNSPEDSKVYLVREGLKQWVMDSAWLTAHGYRWPEDVNIVGPGELEEIPVGDPIGR